MQISFSLFDPEFPLESGFLFFCTKEVSVLLLLLLLLLLLCGIE